MSKEHQKTVEQLEKEIEILKKEIEIQKLRNELQELQKDSVQTYPVITYPRDIEDWWNKPYNPYQYPKIWCKLSSVTDL